MEPADKILALRRRFKSVFDRLPVIAGNEAVNFTLDNFKKQGFQGAVFQPWKHRKNPTKWGKVKRPGRALLVDRARLRRSIRITRILSDAVAIGTDVPYAKVHNEGVNGIGVIQSVKAHTRSNGQDVRAHTRRINMKLPKRQFMGHSPYLERRIKRVASAELLKAMK